METEDQLPSHRHDNFGSKFDTIKCGNFLYECRERVMEYGYENDSITLQLPPTSCTIESIISFEGIRVLDNN